MSPYGNKGDVKFERTTQIENGDDYEAKKITAKTAVLSAYGKRG